MGSRTPVVRVWDDVIADNFAGGGGASTGIELALGRSPDVAVNHDPEAIAMHARNHPDTRHYIESVWTVDPRKATGGKPVKLAWFSPDCKHFSKAKGGKPREQKIRGLAWVACSWAARVHVETIILENVEEFLTWGPLYKHTDGCAGDSGCRAGCRLGQPIKERAGETFRAFVSRLHKLGFAHVEWRILRACDFGAPTTRKRFFLQASRRPIRWPAPTHGPGRAAPHRTAAECIDWAIPCPSIFGRSKPLADKTLARIARGVVKYVLEAGRPFIVPVAHGGVGRDDRRVDSIDAPVRTITGGCRGDLAIAVPYLVHRSNGERVGQAPRIYDVAAPLGTIVAQGQKHALCTAFLAKHYGGHESTTGGKPLRVPFDTITAVDHHSLVAAHLIKFQGTSDAHLSASASGMDEPVPTITAGGWKIAQVAAFLVKYYGTGVAIGVDQPIDALTAKARFGLVTVVIDGEEWVVVDIGMRMLTPRELYRAQGFPEGYQIAPIGPRGKPLTKTAQIRMVGNSVCPPLAAAIVREAVAA